MGIATRNLTQKVTHWETTPDGFGGSTFTEPKVLDARWEDRKEQTRDSEGQEIISNAQVLISDDVNPGDYLYLGETTETDPTKLDSYIVKDFRRQTDLRGLEVIRKAVL